MHYEINVTLNRKHLFATAERSLTTESDMRKLLKTFKNKFPESEGYEIQVSQIETIGYLIDP